MPQYLYSLGAHSVFETIGRGGTTKQLQIPSQCAPNTDGNIQHHASKSTWVKLSIQGYKSYGFSKKLYAIERVIHEVWLSQVNANPASAHQIAWQCSSCQPPQARAHLARLHAGRRLSMSDGISEGCNVGTLRQRWEAQVREERGAAT